MKSVDDRFLKFLEDILERQKEREKTLVCEECGIYKCAHDYIYKVPGFTYPNKIHRTKYLEKISLPRQLILSIREV